MKYCDKIFLIYEYAVLFSIIKYLNILKFLTQQISFC